MDEVKKISRKKTIFFIFFLFLVALAASLCFFFFFKTNTIKKPFLPVKEIQQKIVLRKKINSMSLGEKTAQLMFIGVSPQGWEQLDDWKYSVGGLLVNKAWADIAKTSELIDLETEIASKSATLSFFGVDQEGGDVCRFDWLDCISQKQIKNQQQAFMIAEKRGKELKESGINVVFAPVLDIAENNNDFIWKRTFASDDENETADLGSAMIKGFSEGGIIACPKHFPGHGGTSVDSHLQLPSIKCDKQCLEKRIYPFKKAIDSGAKMIMVGHLLIENGKQKTEDRKRPASLSKYWITDVLRDQLDYNGVIITDDLTMRALSKVNYPSTENINKTIDFWWVGPAAVESIKAGADMVMIVNAPEVQKQVFDRLKKAVETGEISEERVNQILKRILKLKN